MKKVIFLMLAVFAFAAISTAQVSLTLANYTDTLTNAETKTYTWGKTLNGAYYWNVQVIHDHISGSTDSCYCKIMTSIDGTNYFNVPGQIQTISNRFTTADASHIFFGANSTYYTDWIWTTPYVRLSCQHYATGTARIKAYMWLVPVK